QAMRSSSDPTRADTPSSRTPLPTLSARSPNLFLIWVMLSNVSPRAGNRSVACLPIDKEDPTQGNPPPRPKVVAPDDWSRRAAYCAADLISGLKDPTSRNSPQRDKLKLIKLMMN